MKSRIRYDKEAIRRAFDCREFLRETFELQPLPDGLYPAPWSGDCLLKVTKRTWRPADAPEGEKRQDCFSLVARANELDCAKQFGRVAKLAAEFCGIAPDHLVTPISPETEQAPDPAGPDAETARSRGFVALLRSNHTFELLRRDPKAFLLLTVIALRCRYSDNGLNFDGLEVGQALVGDHTSCGLTAAEYRTALKHLREYGVIETDATNKGTIVTIVKRSIYDPLLRQGRDPRDDRAIGRGRAENQLATTKNTDEYRPEGVTPSPSVPEGIQHQGQETAGSVLGGGGDHPKNGVPDGRQEKEGDTPPYDVTTRQPGTKAANSASAHQTPRSQLPSSPFTRGGHQ